MSEEFETKPRISDWSVWGYLPVLAVLLTVWLHTSVVFAQAPEAPDPVLDSGHDIFVAGCASCHGVDGRGAPRSSVAFTTRLPDFTDCSFATKEPDGDWSATIHNGGTARGFSTIMPSFREALNDDQIDKVIEYMRGFCTNKAWPQGDLNFPRALATEKAFPENETVITGAINAQGNPGVGTQAIYERRFGAKNQFELAVPYNFVHDGAPWQSGFGDLVLGYKRLLFHSMKTGSILSVSGEVTTPTGDREKGTGNALTVFESFVSFGQALPRDSFVQVQSGFELPAHTSQAPRAYFARAALGQSFSAGGGLGRTWTPMVELLADRDLVRGAKTNWDVLPQLQIPLSKRQHILANVGVRVPFTNTAGRAIQVVFYLLWDYADGSLKAGW